MSDEPKMIADDVGIMTTAYLLIAIAVKKDKADMHKIAMGISQLDHDILTKYWDTSLIVRQYIEKCFNENPPS